MVRNLLFFIFGVLLSATAFKLLRSTKPDPISPQLQKEIDYGRELFTHTSRYLGLRGSVDRNMATRMNCQNCHLDGGRKPYGISLVSTHARYPEYRARSGKVLSLTDRINNCIERPMNGRPLSPDSREMKALLAFFYYLSRGVPVGSTVKGGNLLDLVKLPKRAANIENGKHLFLNRCTECHGADGHGKLDPEGVEYLFPPLWGPESFNAASNMHRNTKLASFIHANMPLGATVDRPILTYEQSLDLAAFINDPSQHSRPQSRWNDYPNIADKPIDYPFGPYADSFSQVQHRLGPFLEIVDSLRRNQQVAHY